jgi:hypothetical protein
MVQLDHSLPAHNQATIEVIMQQCKPNLSNIIDVWYYFLGGLT